VRLPRPRESGMSCSALRLRQETINESIENIAFIRVFHLPIQEVI